tara:strand:- start:922 stop:1209 length:288 start_codon:yes stop_codon:yes gene_type:complete
MSNYEHGKFVIDENVYTKTIMLTNSYQNKIVVKVTSQDLSTNLFLVNVYNNDRFTVARNTSEEMTVNYVVIESDISSDSQNKQFISGNINNANGS